MIFLDTSYLIALAMRQDALHAQAIAWSRYLPGPFLTTEFVLCEFLNALSVPANRMLAHAVLAGVRENDKIATVPASTDLFKSGVAVHAKRTDQSWSLTDCISFAVMEQAEVTEALTHDHHFEQAGFKALLRKTPPA
ncbi:MAG: type II toxin-antitoxin system VapC family toxin [Phycisphaerae bacterium]|nr:type II toxin-antitoxin system VapC family toxin [Phycisphaerae bacterium]